MIYTNIISFILLPLLVAIVFVSLAALIIGVLGILKTPSKKGKMGISSGILVLIGCCLAAIIFLAKSNKAELQEASFQAAQTGNTAKAKKLVAKGADINEADRDGYTLLRRSIERGDFQMFKTLVEAGADVNDGWPGRRRDETQTPLELVLERSYYRARPEFDYPAVKLLLENGAKFEFAVKDDRRKSCLQSTIEKQQIEILKLMLDNGADINIQNDQGGVLHWAIGNQSIVELLLSHHPDVNAKNNQGYTPLHKAVSSKNEELVSILLEHGADVNAKDNRNSTPLHRAVSYGHKGLVLTLIKHGADVNIKNIDNMTSLQEYLLNQSCFRVKKNIDCEIVQLLIDHGAEFNFEITDNMGKTCLQNAIENNQIEILQLMLENGADIRVQTKQGGVLHWAVGRQTSIPTFEFVLSLGSDINMKDNAGNTPLHRAVACHRKDIIQVLLENGADISIKNNRNMTALEWAKYLFETGGKYKQEYPEVIELLEKIE